MKQNVNNRSRPEAPSDSRLCPIYDYPVGPDVEPVVSISCITYKHENYIRDAIDSFLNQKTSFPVEILVHDDASPDGTAAIIREYEDLYPGLIRGLYQKENQLSQGSEPDFINLKRVRGRYVAFCEGDDFWTDPLKLEKQVRFMEDNPGHAACFAGFTRFHEPSGTSSDDIITGIGTPYKNGFSFGLSDMYRSWLTKTLTALVRSELIRHADFSRYRYYRDIHLFYHVIRDRKAFYFQEIHGVYRVHPGGINSMQQVSINARAAYNSYRELYEHNRDEFTRRMCLLATVSLLNCNIFNRYPGNTIRVNFRLFREALSLAKGHREYLTVGYSFLKKELKDFIKQIGFS